MSKLRLAVSNLWFVLAESDIVPLRTVLALASIGGLFWLTLMLDYGMSVTGIEASRKLMFEFLPLWAWVLLITAYGIAELIIVIFKIDMNFPRGKIINKIVSAAGALMWTLNVTLLVASRLDQDILTMVTAQWAIAGMAWWVFIRDCYGK